jgi:hypothetical protein
MQWHGIHPVINLEPPTNVDSVGILENFSGEILWGLFGFANVAYIPYALLCLL